MKIAAVMIDAWKLTIFRNHLDDSKYVYAEHSGPTPDTLMLKVEYEFVADLKPVIEAANNEAAIQSFLFNWENEGYPQ